MWKIYFKKGILFISVVSVVVQWRSKGVRVRPGQKDVFYLWEWVKCFFFLLSWKRGEGAATFDERSNKLRVWSGQQ